MLRAVTISSSGCIGLSKWLLGAVSCGRNVFTLVVWMATFVRCRMCQCVLSLSTVPQELASDSEDPSTDDEERSATERDIQLRAVTRHYRRLKQGELRGVW